MRNSNTKIIKGNLSLPLKKNIKLLSKTTKRYGNNKK